MAGDIVYDAVKEVYRTEKDLKNMLGDEFFEDPGAAIEEAVGEIVNTIEYVKANEIGSGNADRDFERAAEDLGEIGVDVTAAELKGFAIDTLDTVETLLTNQDLQEEIMGGVMDLEREVERMF